MTQTPQRFAALVLAVLSITAYSTAQNAPPADSPSSGPPPAGQRHAMPNPVNLQVLPKNIKPEELISTMRQYEGQLGVECAYCHAEDPQTHRLNFASDANPKKASGRIMITMTRDINDKYVSMVPGADHQVSCGTCHRGRPIPPNFLTPDQEHPPVPAAASAGGR